MIIDEENQKPLIEEEDKEEEKYPDLFCEICYDNHPAIDFISISPCNHEFCTASLKQFFTFHILQSGEGHRVFCP